MIARPAAERLARRSPACKAPQRARPLRASALTPAARRTGKALIAGLADPQLGKAIPRAIEDSIVSSLDVVTTREDEWDRVASVLGFWGWKGIGSNTSSGRQTDRELDC